MSIKAGQILHDAYGFVIDRIQTGGSTNLNIPEEKIHELGNFQAVATIFDTPDLSFDLETFDVSTEIEALLCFDDPSSAVDGDSYDLSTAVPMDIISPIKDAWQVYTTSKGIIIPYLSLESSTYSFQMRGNSTQKHTLKGDAYFFIDGTPYYEEFPGDGATTDFAFANTAQPYDYQGHTHYALGVCITKADKTSKRLVLEDDFTNTAAGISLTDPTLAPTGSTVKVVYGSATPTDYPQTVHEGVSVKPAALRGKDIDVYIGTTDATPVFSRWTSVQSAEVNFKLTLDKDEEFGNPQYVGQDHDVPEVSGSITVRPRDPDDLWEKVYQVANVAQPDVAGPLTSIGLPMEIRLSDPNTGARLKTLYVPDARFKMPGIQGRVQTKTEVQFAWTSDGGTLLVYKGERNP